jgi:uncharacterized protein with HEPN domain
MDILSSLEIIFNYIGEKTEFEFLIDLMLQDAIIRRFEIIGEASTKISDAIKTNNPKI